MKNSLFFLPTLLVVGLLFSKNAAAQNRPIRCDTMFLRDGSVQLVQKISLTDLAVKFQDCPTGELEKQASKSSVLKIRMANGGRLDFPDSTELAAQKAAVLKKMPLEVLEIKEPKKAKPIKRKPELAPVFESKPKPAVKKESYFNPEFKAWVFLANSPKKMYCSIYEVGDDFVIFKDPDFLKVKIPVSRIDNIRVRRRNNVGRGILIGGLSGMAVGGLIGMASYEPTGCRNDPNAWLCFDFGPGLPAAVGAAGGLLFGTLVGGIIGSRRMKIPINGSRKTLKEQRELLEKYRYE